jgi:hypothetical protein
VGVPFLGSVERENQAPTTSGFGLGDKTLQDSNGLFDLFYLFFDHGEDFWVHLFLPFPLKPRKSSVYCITEIDGSNGQA